MQSRKGEGFAQEHKTASKITFELGQHFEHLKRNEEAISYYRKTLEAVPDHKDVGFFPSGCGPYLSLCGCWEAVCVLLFFY
mgnify:CR=1 FL=1